MKEDYNLPPGLINSSKKNLHYYYDNNDFNHDLYLKYTDEELYNVCYINSSIQCLFHLKKFVNFIMNNEHSKSLLNSTQKLLYDMIENKKKNLSVKEIKMEMGKKDERYRYNSQEDANEFISNYLDFLREETSNKNIPIERAKNPINLETQLLRSAYEKFYNKFFERRGYSGLLDLFYGIYITKRFCKCGFSSVKFSAFNMIELPIYELAKGYKSCLKLNDIMDSYFSKSRIYGATCGKCEKGEIYTKTSIYKLPDNLIIFFGRTANDEYINIPIKYSEYLELNKSWFDNSDSVDNTYFLSGIIHYISFGEKIGHYTASCRVNDKWYYFDDTWVSPKKVNQNEIILFYEISK